MKPIACLAFAFAPLGTAVFAHAQDGGQPDDQERQRDTAAIIERSPQAFYYSGDDMKVGMFFASLIAFGTLATLFVLPAALRVFTPRALAGGVP